MKKEKVIESEILESTGYRALFECVKKEGIAPVFALAQDVRDLPKNNILVKQTILGQENSLTVLEKKNKEIIKYLNEHESEFNAIDFEDANVYNTLAILLKDSSLINLYLENAKKSEKLQVAKIAYLSPKDYEFKCGIYRNINGDIINIKKCFTDGNIYAGKEILVDKEFCYSEMPVYISSPTFILHATNFESENSFRSIKISDFDGSKLPTEEEVQSYDIPKSLIKSNRNES